MADDLQKQVDDAKAALDLTNNPAFVSAISEVKNQVVNKWVSGEFKTVEDREEAFHTVRAVELLQEKLRVLVDRGSMASAQIERSKRAPAQKN